MIKSTGTIPFLEITLAIGFLLLLFTIGILFLRYFSGWYLIEKIFRSENKSPDHYLDYGLRFQFGWQTIRISTQKTFVEKEAGYMKIAVTNTGIYLGFLFPYFLFLRSVNLPWNEIDIQKELASENYEIIIKKVLKFRIILSSELASKLTPHKR